jgi:hypothetical protein
MTPRLVFVINTGNKGDDLVNREIEKEEAKALAEKYDIHFLYNYLIA